MTAASTASTTICRTRSITFNTHDLSTYAGWRSFSDLKLKRSLGLDPGETDEARWHALGMLDEVLRQHDIHENDLYAIARFLARTRSRLMAISLEDLLGVIDQPNIPGTVDEHPNWRRRLPVCGRGDRRDHRCRALEGRDPGNGCGSQADMGPFSASGELPSRIEDYGLIGDCETAALVGRDGSIDWLCWPAFDSDACFAALLGTNKNGRWLIAPAGARPGARRAAIADNTLILQTRFETADGIVELDRFHAAARQGFRCRTPGARRRGTVKMRMQLVIRFGFGIDIPWVKRTEDRSALLAICGPGHDGAAYAGRNPRRGHDDGCRFRGERRRDRALRAHLWSLASRRCPSRSIPRPALRETEAFWKRMVAAAAPIRASIAPSCCVR